MSGKLRGRLGGHLAAGAKEGAREKEDRNTGANQRPSLPYVWPGRARKDLPKPLTILPSYTDIPDLDNND